MQIGWMVGALRPAAAAAEWSALEYDMIRRMSVGLAAKAVRTQAPALMLLGVCVCTHVCVSAQM